MYSDERLRNLDGGKATNHLWEAPRSTTTSQLNQKEKQVVVFHESKSMEHSQENQKVIGIAMSPEPIDFP